jgi:hypothetical protein
MERYRAGDWSAAVDIWMAGVGGADYRAAMERALPGALDHAVADADTFFGQELPAVREWSFGRDDAQRIEQPVLCVLGGCSDDVSPVHNQRHELLLDWLSHVEAFVLPGATHLLHVQNPGEMAERRDVEPLPDRGRVDPSRHAELVQDVRDVHAGGLYADGELGRNLPVGVAAGEEQEHLALPGGESERVHRIARAGRRQALEVEPGTPGE